MTRSYSRCTENLSSFQFGVWTLVLTSINENKRSYNLLNIYHVPLDVSWMSHLNSWHNLLPMSGDHAHLQNLTLTSQLVVVELIQIFWIAKPLEYFP